MNSPLECVEPECSALYCTYCISNTNTTLCLACNGDVTGDISRPQKQNFKKPSNLVMRLLNQYMIKCSRCQKSVNYADINQHETRCRQLSCSNELCSVKFKENTFDSRIKFNFNGEDLVACSKKCQKVTKFSILLLANDESQILTAFETMLKKKAQKNNRSD